MSDTKTIRVRPVKIERAAGAPNLVILDDQNEAHPKGHVVLRQDSAAAEVGDVPRVRELIAAGVLEEVQPKAEPKADAK